MLVEHVVRQVLQYPLGARPLQGHERVSHAHVVDLRVRRVGVPFDPFEIFFCVGSIDDQQKVFGVDPVDEQVVDHARALVGEHRVLHLVVGQLRDVVGREALDERERARAYNFDLAHVRNVKQPGGFANGHVLRDRPGVLDGHFPADEIDHACPQRDVSLV